MWAPLTNLVSTPPHLWAYRTLRAVLISRRLRKIAQQCPFYATGPLTEDQKTELGTTPYLGKPD